MTSANKSKGQEKLLEEMSAELAQLTGKPEQYVMIIIQNNVPMIFAGDREDCCYIEVKSIGSLSPSKMSKVLSNLIHSRLGISANRVYINFEDIDASKWGFNGNTFG